MRKRFLGLMIVIWAICLTISIANAADITAGLVGHWPLDGDASDKTGNNDGVVIGDPTWEAGQKGQAINIDGVDDYVNIPGFSLNTDTVTFTAWVSGWKTTSWTGILCTRNPSGDKPIEEDGTADKGRCEGIRFGQSDRLHYEWGDNSATWNWDEGPVLPQNEWAFIAGVIEPDKVTVYVYTDAKGLESAENVINHDKREVTDLRIGFDTYDGIPGRAFKGLIDDARVYDRALSKDEIQAVVEYEPTAMEPAGKITTTWGTIKY
ncbi:LamG domain-containing protein [Candidatus Poribacteria bacterium]